MSKKEELIKKINFRRINCPSDSWDRGHNSAIEYAIDIVQQLDEPKKVIVPKYVAEWIEMCKEKYDLCRSVSTMVHGPVNDWYCDNQEKYEQAWVNGYEVEKEPRWVIKVGNMYFINWGEDGCTPSFVLNDILGQEEQIPKWFSKESADKIAKQLGGTAEWWED